jgi:8-oxo-dGTP diphosphatase
MNENKIIQQIGVKAFIEKDEKILFIKRSEKYEHLNEAWDIPGGRLDFGEEPEEGLKRELKEETGLELNEIKQILYAITVFKNEETQIVRITYLCILKDGQPQLSQEHTELQWIPTQELKTLQFKDKILEKTMQKFASTRVE